MDIYIAGVSTTKFGELWDVSPRTLAKQAAFDALADAGMELPQVQALYVGNLLSGMLGGQEHLGAFFAEELGLRCPAFKIEGACASGGLAFHNAYTAVLSGLYETVLVLGIEKMTDYKPEEVARALMGAGSDEERLAGATFPSLYACLARSHMDAFGTTMEEISSVSAKNHFHASLNPKAQFRVAITVDQVMRSSLVADPLRLLHCSPISDGAAAVIVSSRPVSKKNPVRVLASSVSTDSLGLAQRASLTELSATKNAATAAFTRASVSPSDINVAELHDCFAIAEILAMEDIGFCGKGEAAKLVSSGKTRIDGKARLVVNTSGGLKGCGHPVGATGVKQIVELVDQLRGRCGDRQVKNASLGLAQNVGGSGATAVVTILGK